MSRRAPRVDRATPPDWIAALGLDPEQVTLTAVPGPLSTPCLLVAGRRVVTSSDGYPGLRAPGSVTTVRLHRLALEHSLGRLLDADEHAHHRCENRACCAVDHLLPLARWLHAHTHARLRAARKAASA